jgi:hypothetical protein
MERSTLLGALCLLVTAENHTTDCIFDRENVVFSLEKSKSPGSLVTIASDVVPLRLNLTRIPNVVIQGPADEVPAEELLNLFRSCVGSLKDRHHFGGRGHLVLHHLGFQAFPVALYYELG